MKLDALTWHIMDATADDWESIDQVIPHVEHFLGPQDREQIKVTILRLFDDGLFELMPLQGVTTETLKQDFQKCWFSMNSQGRQIWDAAGIYYRDEA